MSDYRRGLDLVIGFIEHLQIATTSDYSSIANWHTLQFTTARTKSSSVIAWWRFATVSSGSLLTFLQF
jgi:hypothetical protein